MANIQPYYDAIGGADNLSSSFSLREFATPRIEEILMLSETLNEEPTKGLVFQRLPKYMRRRQMSHHQSRLPRTLRSAFAAQKKLPTTKRPSRKYRRKPSNLLAEYNRRKKSKIWLETHIWHAKRFHMVDKWGYRLADRPTNRGFRSNYRAIKSHCLLLDVSYLSVIELVGSEENLSIGLKKCTSGDCGLTFMAKSFINTSREGSVTLFHPESYPYRAIGNVSFLWQPKTSVLRKLWVWAHPAFHNEVIECFSNAFSLNTCDPENNIPTYKSDNLTMKSFKDQLNRFKLIGPLSSCVLADSLQVATSNETPIPLTNMENIECSASKKIKLDSSLVKNGIQDQCSVSEDETLSGLSNRPPYLYPSGATFGVCVVDPRMTAPRIRTKSVYNSQGAGVENWKWNLASCPLWEESTRDSVSNNRLSDHQINHMRSKLIVPDMQIQHNPVSVPILLIQQPGKEGFGAGWDVIIPSKWAVTFWRSFVLRGARTGGLREIKQIKLEMPTLKTSLQPDSNGGILDQQENESRLQERFFKLPPSKRPNYIKLGIFQPFSTPWSSILSNCYVIRDFKFLINLSECLKKKHKFLMPCNSDGLIAISLKCNTGKPDALARLYLPDNKDFRSKEDIKEPVHPDFKKPKRIEIREKNKKLLKIWRRERIKKKSGGETKWKESDIQLLKSSKNELMQKNWLLDEPTENARNVIGFVTVGDFQFISGNGLALGYVKLTSILEILDLSIRLKVSPMILLRNVNQFVYRKSSFEILLN